MWPFLAVMMMLQISAGEVNLNVSPAHLDVGLSPSLDVNCTFTINTSSAMAEIISLTVSRGNNTQLATTNTFSAYRVEVTSSEGITADGVINPGGQSYIHLHWDYPMGTQEGTYQCEASGLDLLGQTVIDSSTAVVTQDQADGMDLMDKIREMDNRTKELDQRLSSAENYTRELEEKLVQSENYTNELENKLSLNEDYIKTLEQNVSITYILQNIVNDHLLTSIFEMPPLIYQNQTYLLSQIPFTDFNDTLGFCKALGGQMAEIDDLDEYHRIQDYVKTFSGIDHVFIGGTDEGHDGTWVLPSSNQNLPVADWHSPAHASSGSDLYNCLCLYSAYDWRMETHFCHFGSNMVRESMRFMCEVPQS